MATLKFFNPVSMAWEILATGAKGAKGDPGNDGLDGADGAGVPAAGATGQVLAKASGTDYDTAWIDLPTLALDTLASSPHTLLQADAEKILEVTSGSAFTVSLPLNASQAIAAPSLYTITQIGAGVVTIEAVAGVTLNGVDGGSYDISAQYGSATLYKRATDAWIISGAIEVTP